MAGYIDNKSDIFNCTSMCIVEIILGSKMMQTKYANGWESEDRKARWKDKAIEITYISSMLYFSFKFLLSVKIHIYSIVPAQKTIEKTASNISKWISRSKNMSLFWCLINSQLKNEIYNSRGCRKCFQESFY